MPICPRCQSETVVHSGKMVCPCGYQYNLSKKVPTYNELMEFIKEMDYEKELESWLEME